MPQRNSQAEQPPRTPLQPPPHPLPLAIPTLLHNFHVHIARILRLSHIIAEHPLLLWPGTADAMHDADVVGESDCFAAESQLWGLFLRGLFGKESFLEECWGEGRSGRIRTVLAFMPDGCYPAVVGVCFGFVCGCGKRRFALGRRWLWEWLLGRRKRICHVVFPRGRAHAISRVAVSVEFAMLSI